MLLSSVRTAHNPYFTLGATGLAHEVERAGLMRPLFVNFSAGNIAALLPTQFIPDVRRYSHVVLIADAHLYPLALCYQENFSAVMAVFKSSTPPRMIISALRHLRSGEKMRLPRLQNGRSISYKEAFVLEETLSGIPADRLATHYHRDTKTIYGWRKKIARKLGVRHLNHLLMQPADRGGDASA